LTDGFGRDFSFASARYWTTTDLDGDGFLDIVHTGDTAFTTRVWDATGNPYWKVYAGSASGWSAAATMWPVAKNGRTEGFFADGEQRRAAVDDDRRHRRRQAGPRADRRSGDRPRLGRDQRAALEGVREHGQRLRDPGDTVVGAAERHVRWLRCDDRLGGCRAV